ncbi:cyclin-dependent kinase 14 [Cricetulus griseus]|nr:cyclin-dependent kinase 14 [Cricetulus griseus]
MDSVIKHLDTIPEDKKVRVQRTQSTFDPFEKPASQVKRVHSENNACINFKSSSAGKESPKVRRHSSPSSFFDIFVHVWTLIIFSPSSSSSSSSSSSYFFDIFLHDSHATTAPSEHFLPGRSTPLKHYQEELQNCKHQKSLDGKHWIPETLKLTRIADSSPDFLWKKNADSKGKREAGGSKGDQTAGGRGNAFHGHQGRKEQASPGYQLNTT